jgi:hypothetical protein
MSFEELLAVVDDIDGETRKFDFTGVHAADIHPYFHRNDGRAADRVADVLVGVNDRRQPFVSLSSALRGTRPNPSLGQIAKGAASLLLGSAATERLRSWFSPARHDKRIEPSDVRRLLERIAAHDKCDPSLFAVERARCAKTGLPLASIAIHKRPARA